MNLNFRKIVVKHIGFNLLIYLYFTIEEPQRWRGGLERWFRKRKVWCSNPSRDRPKSQKGRY